MTSMIMSMIKLDAALPVQSLRLSMHVPGIVVSQTFLMGVHMKMMLIRKANSHAAFKPCTSHNAYLNLELLMEKTRA